MSRIAITGSTGLIGEALTASLQADDHTVARVVRDASRAGSGDVVWDPRAGTIDAGALEGVDAVVHLAGEPIGAARWTPEVKRRIRQSRVDGTRLIAETLAGLEDRPEVLVTASGVDYYGDRGAEILTEDSGPGESFLAEVCIAWEAAAAPADEAGIRTTHARTGVVIASGGPLIDKVELPFKLGVGGRIGHGRQYMPWIALDDHVRALRALIDGAFTGPVNLVAPEPVTNRELTAALGAVLRRPTVFPIPTFALQILYGEMGVTLATESKRVVPRRLLDAGFTFDITDIREALAVAFDRAA